jgi:prophage antirepressor-like protein
MNIQNQIVPFDFEGQAVRTVLIGGNPWWVNADACAILGIENPRDAIANFPENERMTVDTTDGHSGKRGGAQSLNLINEPGLYRLIFQSRKPEAERFKTWVFTEVLPQIRKTGRYVLPGSWDPSKTVFPFFSRPDARELLANLARLLDDGIISREDFRDIVTEKTVRMSWDETQTQMLKKFVENNFIHTGNNRDYIVIDEAYRRYCRQTPEPLSRHAFTGRINKLFSISIMQYVQRVKGKPTHTFVFYRLAPEALAGK